jgi:ATP-binding protein involved in chromosome partitioning
MSELTQDAIKEAIKGYVEPNLEKDLVTAKAIKAIAIEAGKVSVTIELAFPPKGCMDDISAAVREKIEALPGVESVAVDIGVKIVAHSVQ